MAGFFPHTGFAYGDYTALSMSAASGILDSICADISNSGGSVNGWSLYADYRTGSTLTAWVPNNGRWMNQTNQQQGSWTFTSGSPFVVGEASYGYGAAVAFPVYNTGTGLLISVDSTTWYTASYYTWAGFNGRGSASLDRPYAGASTYTLNLYMKAPASIVLKCASTSSRDFYVEIGMPASGNMGAAALIIRPWERFDTVTSSARFLGNYGQMDAIRLGYNFYGVGTGSDTQYVMCLYPDAFVFWMSTLGSPEATVYYVGNLDTSEGAAIPADKGACWAGTTDTSYSGLLKASGPIFGTQFIFFGNSMMNRTIDEQPAWTDMDVYHVENIRRASTYQVKARGRAYCDWPWGFTVNYDGKVELLPLDVYQAGYGATTYYNSMAGCWSAREFFRGKLKYMYTFATSPASQNLVTHPGDGGIKYMCLRAGRNANGRGSTTIYHVDEDFDMSVDAPSSFAQAGIIISNYSEYSTSTAAQVAYGSIMRYFAVPIL